MMISTKMIITLIMKLVLMIILRTGDLDFVVFASDNMMHHKTYYDTTITYINT